jgi:hypothetical protein
MSHQVMQAASLWVAVMVIKTDQQTAESLKLGVLL